MKAIKILIFGDIVGNPGCAMLSKHIAKLKAAHQADAVIVNGENSATSGRGISKPNMTLFKTLGVDMVTSGNHIWDRKDIYSYFTEHKDLLRPANFPAGVPGSGLGMFMSRDHRIAVINVQGRVFMRENIDCPFQAVDTALTYLKHQTPIIIVDFHAETTSEKQAMGYYLDGRVSVVVGTHTHVQTADARILPKGTAYITDLGMAGALNSMLGMKKEPIIEKFLTQMPQKFEVEYQPPYFISGVCVTISPQTGKALEIVPFRVVDEDLIVNEE